MDHWLVKHSRRIQEIGERHGVVEIRVFGSQARGESTESSDVDLLVRLERGRGLFDLIGFRQGVEDLVGRPIDVVTECALSPYLRTQILAEARPLGEEAA